VNESRVACIGHSPDGERWWDPVKNGLGTQCAEIGIGFLNPAGLGATRFRA
jgi:hypothetical protein